MADPESESEKLIASLFAEKERAAGAPIATATPEPTSEPTSQEIIAGLFANKDASTEVSTDSQKIIAEAFANKAVSQVPQVPEVPQVPADIEVAPPQVTEEATRRKSQAELIEEYEARRAPAPGSVFEGREPLPFEERPPDRDPLGIITGAPQAFQRNVLEPISALATTVETPFSVLQNPAVSLARYLMDRIPGVDAGLPGFSNEFAFNPNQIPGQPDWRERYRENIPIGTRFVSEASLDPLNLIPGVGLTRIPSRLNRGCLLYTSPSPRD